MAESGPPAEAGARARGPPGRPDRPAAGAGLSRRRAGRGGAARRAGGGVRRRRRREPGEPAAVRPDQCDRGGRGRGMGPHRQLGGRESGPGGRPGHPHRRRCGDHRSGRPAHRRVPGLPRARVEPAGQPPHRGPRPAGRPGRRPLPRQRPGCRRPGPAHRAVARHRRGGRARRAARPDHRACAWPGASPGRWNG